jgi:two-component system nitrogen regulation response regulator NtrX
MISGHGSIDTAVRATRMGAFDFLEKPLSLEKLLLVVRNALRQRKLEERNRRLVQEVLGEPRLIGSSSAARRLQDSVERLAPGAEPVLLVGEDGCGKATFARAVHAAGPRALEPFVEVHAAGIPPDRFGIELFGGDVEPGGSEPSRGRLSLADGGTLLVRDLEALPDAMQVELERFLGTGTFAGAGGAERRADVRMFGSSTLDLESPSGPGGVRPSLLRLLGATRVEIPPLRERGDDLPLLAAHFLEEFSRVYGRGPMVLEPDAIAALREHAWPSNVRELRNVMEQLAISSPAERVHRGDLPTPLGRAEAEDDPFQTGRTLREGREMFERQFILRRLAENDYNVTRTARVLGLERSHLHRKIKTLGLE